MSIEKFVVGLVFTLLLGAMLFGSACDMRKQKFYLDMTEKNFCRTVIGEKELWRPCNSVMP